MSKQCRKSKMKKMDPVNYIYYIKLNHYLKCFKNNSFKMYNNLKWDVENTDLWADNYSQPLNK